MKKYSRIKESINKSPFDLTEKELAFIIGSASGLCESKGMICDIIWERLSYFLNIDYKEFYVSYQSGIFKYQDKKLFKIDYSYEGRKLYGIYELFTYNNNNLKQSYMGYEISEIQDTELGYEFDDVNVLNEGIKVVGFDFDDEESSSEHIPTKVVYWYDKISKNWITQVLDEKGYEIESEYSGNKEDAIFTCKQFSKEYNNIPYEKFRQKKESLSNNKIDYNTENKSNLKTLNESSKIELLYHGSQQNDIILREEPIYLTDSIDLAIQFAKGYAFNNKLQDKDVPTLYTMDVTFNNLLTITTEEEYDELMDITNIDNTVKYLNENNYDGIMYNDGEETYYLCLNAKKQCDIISSEVLDESLTEKVSPKDYNPTKTGKAYKVFRVKNGKLYPPMVANQGGQDTPIGVWLDAEEGEFAGLSKTGRPQVKSTGSGNLAYRPGWHLGDVPRAKQFDRLNKETGEYEFPKDFVWAECDYVMDIDYQDEADEQGYMRTKVDDNGNVTSYKSDKYQHSLAGLKKLPNNGYYKYRTNPNPDTVPWVITGQMKVDRLLSDDEVNNILKSKGIQPIHRQGGDKTLKELGLSESLSEELLSTERFDVFVTDSPYQTKNKLKSSKDEMRVYINKTTDTYLVCTAFEATHTDMIELADKNGFNFKQIDDFDKNQICILYVPKEDEYFDEEDDALSDDYDTLYEYEDGSRVYSRYQNFEDFELCKILGKYTKKTRKTIKRPMYGFEGEYEYMDIFESFYEDEPSKVLYRTGDLDFDKKIGLFFTDDLNYYKYNTSYGWDKSTDIKKYELDLSKAKVFDPMKDWDLGVENWAVIRCDLDDLQSYGYVEGKYDIEYLDDIDYDDPDEYHEVLVDTDGLAYFGYDNGYDVTVLRDIPSSGYDSSKKFTEYCVHNKNIIKELNESLKESDDSNLKSQIEQDILAIEDINEFLKVVNIETHKEPSMVGPMYLLKDGSFIYVNDYVSKNKYDSESNRTHTGFIGLMMDEYVENKYNFNPNNIYLSPHTIRGILEENGLIRLNTGSTASDKRFYMCLPSGDYAKPTYAQYNSLLEFLDLNTKEVWVYIGNKWDAVSQKYVDYIPEDVIKKIKRYYASGTLYESKEEYNWKDDYDALVNIEINNLNKWLSKYGFEVELITDEDVLDDIDWENSVAMFLGEYQDNASVFPIALNKDYILNNCEDKQDLVYGIRGSIWHEAGHGIFRYLNDFYNLDDLDEEEVVEDFAKYQEDSELFNILTQYINEREDFNESIKEDIDTITLYTVQDRSVLDKLNKGETYIANYKNIFDMDYLDLYKKLSSLYNFKNCPIFCADEDSLHIIESSGIKANGNKELITLKVPRSEVKVHNYYDWTDYLFFHFDDDGTFETEEEIDKYLLKLEDRMKNQICGDDEDKEYVIDRIEPSWLVKDNLEEKMKPYYYQLNRPTKNYPYDRYWFALALKQDKNKLKRNKYAIQLQTDDIEIVDDILKEIIPTEYDRIRILGSTSNLKQLKQDGYKLLSLSEGLEEDLYDDYKKLSFKQLQEIAKKKGWELTKEGKGKPSYFLDGDQFKLNTIRYILSHSDDVEDNKIEEDLSQQQIDYFKNSKVRDKDGNLLVVYHGTPNPGFKEFNPKDNKSQFGRYKFGDYNVNYFTKDKDSARSYTNIGIDEGNNIYACYLNIVNPYIVNNTTEAEMKSSFNIKDNRLRQKEIQLFEKIFNKWKNKMMDYSDFRFKELNNDLKKLNLELKPSDIYKENTDPEDIEYFDLYTLGNNSFFGAEHPIFYQYSIDEIFSDDMYDELRDMVIGEPDDYFFSTDDIVRYVISLNEEDGENYDGIIIPDIIDSKEMFSNITTDYITLISPNQIKLVDNKNPTSSSRIDEEILKEIYPNKGESKKDFISRFMKVTKDEYPDRKQRFAVCMSYWNRRNKKRK